jgi:hypothetical protein
MNTRSDTYTKQLIEYLKVKPEGRYAPYDVRMELGISPHSWQWFATRHVYPEGSEVRAKLSEIGVEIETVLKTSKPRLLQNLSAGRMYPTSVFVVKQRSR